MKKLAVLLAVVTALEPGAAHAARVIAQLRPVAAPGAAVSAPAAIGHITLAHPAPGLGDVYLQGVLSLPALSLPSAETAVFGPLEAASVAPAVQAAPSAAGDRAISRSRAFSILNRRITGVAGAAADSVKDLGKMGSASSYEAAGRQMDALTGEHGHAYAAPVEGPSAKNLSGFKGSRLSPAKPAATLNASETPAPKTGIGGWLGGKTRIFRDQERNRAFWRMFLGEAIYLFGFQMYVVALPFLMKSFTRNTLAENGQLRDATAEALNAMVRENRSLARFAHWAAQAVSYVAIPLFDGDGSAGPKKWLVRSAMIRSAVIFGIPAVFFASGFLSVQAALWVLLGLIGAQSFFQGVYVIMMTGATARLMGHKSVLPSERMRANSMRTFLSAVIAIIAPFIAGKIASLPDWLGKAGTGSAVIYGIYAASVAIAGLIFATIRIFAAQKNSPAPDEAALNQAPRVKGLWGAVKNAGVSMVKGIRLVWQNRYLRTLLILNLISSLFADPLVLNVLPEFVEGVFAASPGALDSMLALPFVGWFFKGLVGTPMGFFALLMTSSSLGIVAASRLLNPMRKLFEKLGFAGEERLTIPFYILAFLQVPAFWMMIHTASFPLVLGLYGLQTFLAGFVGMLMTGIYQKKIRDYGDLQMNQVLAANSFVSIIAAIAATLLYGFVLNGVAISTSLWIAGIATTVLGVLQLVSPWLLFSKEERSKPGREDAPSSARSPTPVDARPTNHGHEHLPAYGNHGPLHVGL